MAELWVSIKEAVSDWQEDNAQRLAASLACYTLLSLAPLVLFAVSLAGLLFGDDAARGQIASEISGVVGAHAGQAIEDIALSARDRSTGVLSSIVGLVVLLFGASGVFGELQSSLDAVWEVKPKPDRGIVRVIKDRFFSFTMVMGVAFLLMVSLLISAGISALGRFMESALPGGEALWAITNFLISLGLITLIFALVLKVVPDVKIRWRDVWVGAAVTALLFTLGKLALGLYLGKSTFTSSYGAAGSLVALVVWVYYSAQILFFGAELTQVWARRAGAAMQPTEKAVPRRDTA